MNLVTAQTAQRTDGLHGSMDAGDFVRLVHRNCMREDVRFVRQNGGHALDAPRDTFTIIIGPRKNGDCYNIPAGQIPEYSVENADTMQIVARGWRQLLIWLFMEYVLDPSSEELEKVLGPAHFQKAVSVALRQDDGGVIEVR